MYLNPVHLFEELPRQLAHVICLARKAGRHPRNQSVSKHVVEQATVGIDVPRLDSGELSLATLAKIVAPGAGDAQRLACRLIIERRYGFEERDDVFGDGPGVGVVRRRRHDQGTVVFTVEMTDPVEGPAAGRSASAGRMTSAPVPPRQPIHRRRPGTPAVSRPAPMTDATLLGISHLSGWRSKVDHQEPGCEA